MTDGCDLTQAIARYAVESRFDALPQSVQREAVRAFLNWIGVAIGGCHEAAPTLAARFVADKASKPVSAIIGHELRTDVASAAFVNCIASSVLAYDDAHLPTVAHPSGPAASALFALAQSQRVSGEELLNALALGIEIQCRIANMLVQPPAPMNPGLYVNGFSGPIGIAAAVGRILELDQQKMRWAIGIAASQASGFRAVHGTMTSHFRPGYASQAGICAALLAQRGFDCIDNALEASGGFVDVYAAGSDSGRALAGLGREHEMLTNRYKPYPCGIVIHPVIDACQQIRKKLPRAGRVVSVKLRVNPLVLSLTGKRSPQTPLESHVSVFHWAAVSLLVDSPGLAATQPTCLQDPDVVRLRDQVEAVARPEMGKGEAIATVLLADGSEFSAHVLDARGSQARPMTDEELKAKFFELSRTRLPTEGVHALYQTCERISQLADVGNDIGTLLP